MMLSMQVAPLWVVGNVIAGQFWRGVPSGKLASGVPPPPISLHTGIIVLLIWLWGRREDRGSQLIMPVEKVQHS